METEHPENIYIPSKTSFEEKIDRVSDLYGQQRLTLEDAAAFLDIDESEVCSLLHQRGMLPSYTVLVLGGAGFIGSNFIHRLITRHPNVRVVNYDKLTYAGNIKNLTALKDNPQHVFVQADIANYESLRKVFETTRIDYIVNFAAETHVDRSIHGHTKDFIQTNVYGVFNILSLIREFPVTKYVHISTDEVYGALQKDDTYLFTEEYPLSPRNPYSATKASGDALCLSFYHTYGIPVTIVRPSNNYGPHQYPEKLVPYFVHLAQQGKPLPLYGDGKHMREWLFVRDNCAGIEKVMWQGKVGEIYNIGGGNERENIEVARMILHLLGKPQSLLAFTEDRLGHDRRYALDSSKIQRELAWRPETSFEEGLADTVAWYVNNYEWILESLRRGALYEHYAGKK
jgi:dTDP-glucose 4,6-dehydratase